MQKKRLLINGFFHLILLSAIAGGTLFAADFKSDVYPIFKEKCFRCHSSKKQKGELRLDSADWIRKGGENGDVLVPFHPEKSRIYILTTYPEDDPDYMPSKGDGLTESEIKKLETWIKKGAPFGDEAKVPSTRIKIIKEKTPTIKSKKYEATATELQAFDQLKSQGVLISAANYDSSLFEIVLSYSEIQEKPFPVSQFDSIKDRIYKIDFSGTLVTDQDLSHLKHFRNLTHLDLSSTNVSDLGLSYLTHASSLEYLNLHNTKVSDQGLKSLSNLKKLKNLYLWGSDTTKDGAKNLKLKLPDAYINTGEI